MFHRALKEKGSHHFLCGSDWKGIDQVFLISVEVWVETWPLTCSWAVAASIFCRVCSTVDEDMEIGTLCLNHLISSHIQDSCKRSHKVISSSKPVHDLGCGIKAQQGEGNLTPDVCSLVHFQIWMKQLFDLCPIGKRSEC